MFSLLTRVHISKRAKKFRISTQRNYNDLIVDIQRINYSECKIIFSWLFDFGSNILNACALFPKVVIFNSEWAAHLVLFYDEQTINAFMGTLGHELAHKDNDLVVWSFWPRDRKFVNWVNEVHADFSGAEKVFCSRRNNQIDAIQYKLRYKGKKDKDSFEHPSWKRRLEYVSNFDFDSKLIRKIALDVGCNNKNLIENATNHFLRIKLY